MSSGPHITTVIPTYRRPALLRRAIESALAQTYPNVRVLVCDNASGDATAEVVEELARRDPRIAYHVQPDNLGAVANFQYGLDAVETEYFSFLSDDDFLLPDFYRVAIANLAEHATAKFFCGLCVVYDEQSGSHRLHPSRYWSEGLHEARASARRMLEHYFLWTSCLFHSDIRNAMGAFEPIPIGDIMFLGKAAALYSFVVAQRPCAVLVETGTNTIDRLTIEDVQQTFDVMRVRCAEIPGLSPDEREEIRHGLDRSARLTVNGIMRSALAKRDWGRFDAAADYLRKHDALDWRKRVRVSLAAHRDPPSLGLRAMLRLLDLHERYQTKRRSRSKPMSIEEIAGLYEH